MTALEMVGNIHSDLSEYENLRKKLIEFSTPGDLTVESTLDRLLKDREIVVSLLDKSGAVNYRSDYPRYKSSLGDLAPLFLKPSRKRLVAT